MKNIFSCIKNYKKDTLLTPVFVVAEILMEVLIPYFMASLIDFGIDKGNMEVVYKIGLFLVLSTVFSLTFGALAGVFGARASSGFAKNLRHQMYENVQNFSFSNIDKFSTASIITRLTTDVTNVQNAFQMGIRVAVRSPIMLTFALLMAFKVNAKVSIVFLILIPFLGSSLFFIISKAHPIFTRVFKTYDRLNTIVQENLRGIRLVKSYVREDFEVSKFKNISEIIFKDFSLAEKILAFNAPLIQFSIYSAMLLISWFGARLIVAGQMSTGELMSLIFYATQILMSLMMLSMVFVMLTMAKSSAERISEILDEKSDIINPLNPQFQMKDGSIIFKNINFSYSKKSEKLCLKNIDFKINSGEVIGIIGGTGSGKTSLVQLIPRLYDVTEGEVIVGGVDVKNYDLDTLRNNVSMVLQKNTLFSGSLKDNLSWGNPNATEKEMIEACELAQAHEFIEKFPQKYNTYIEQEGTNLSGGQKQRVCIARALLKKPKILILDDSTSAVDTKTDSRIRDGFKKFIPDTTKIIIAQRISSIEDADKIIVMDNGEINSIGTHDELLKSNPIYKEIYDSQTKGSDINE